MSHPALPTARTRTRHRATSYLTLAALLLPSTAACTSADTDTSPKPATAAGSTTPPQVTGPLCAALPTGTDPGNPTFLAGQPVDAALQWIPTLTTFEAALRTTGLLTELDTTTGVTLLAPSDDAFAAKFSDDNWDDLMVRHHDDLRTLLKAHLITGTHPLDDLTAAGTTTTVDGTTLTVTPTRDTARFADRAEAVCADYQATNARIHIVNAVLGTLPTTADGNGHRAH
ncbi:fasciclin domain-containing protein [Micromonospora sp. PLK6-60]|uniref:fasciclin domain-containing protein n=1 Tax=Micromonospora sp. PLK6-60 TaxID=2873383 RepID=UPI001CA7AB35|nr:fasciclin domain-containing protein [Micromonospora sp. PLK6-60]MBY8875011.1 fasciclin domain-containing protein [Micromonospora sp. PLK6-60]